MATASGYHGGIGGKFRRRPLRRSAATPYDRPASAARGGPSRGLVAAVGGVNGWLSKLVDPASRFIASSASRFFASVFRKRLTAPPAEPETGGANDPIGEEDIEVVSAPSLEVVEGIATDLTNLPNNSGADSISELEQILKQKTLTRDEFERLTDILRSRIINSNYSDPVTRNENIGSTSEKHDVPHAEKHAHVVVPADPLESSRSHGDQSKTLMKLAIPEDETASPAELAKAYMGSRTTQLPSSALNLWNHVFPEENKMPSMLGANPLFSVGQRSILRAPAAAAECPQDGYLTPRPLGRSAIFKMSRSPYFRSNVTSSVKVCRHPRDDPSSSFQTSKSIAYSGGKELLKRGSSVLDTDLRSFGPIRRTRQKFNQTSPLKDMPPGPAGKLPLMTNTDVNGDSTSVQTTLNMDELNYNDIYMQNSEREFSRADLAQSSKIAMKISQELNKFVPSPKEKSSKILSLGESNIKSSCPLIESQSLRNFKDLDFSEFKTFGYLGDMTPGRKSSLAQKQQEATHNRLSTSVGSGVKLPYGNFKNHDILPLPGFVTSKSAFEGSLEVNNHAPVLGETSAAPLTLKERIGLKISLDKSVGLETATHVHCDIGSSTSILSPVSKVSNTEEGKAFSRTISENDMDFSVPLTYLSNSFSIPPTPTMPSPLVQKTTVQKDQLTAPLVNFGSKGVNDIAVSSNITTAIRPITTDTLQDSTRSNFSKSTLAQVPILDDVGEAPKSRVVFRSFGTVDSTEKPEPSTPVFGFGVKAVEDSSNGSLYSSSSLPFSAVVTVALSANDANLSSNSDSSLSSVSLVSSASVYVDAPVFKFGSEAVHQVLDKTNISPLESSTNSKTGNDIMPTLAISQLSSSSCSTLTSGTIPSMESSSFAQVESAVSSNMGGNQSAKVPELPSLTLNKSNTLFGSTQSSSSIIADYNSKTSSAVFTGGTGSVFGAQDKSGSDILQFSKSSANKFCSLSSSSSFGLDSFTPSRFGGFQFGSASTDSKPLNSSFSSSPAPYSSNSTTTSSFAPQSSSGSTGFSFVTSGATNANASSFQPSTSSFSPNAPTSSAAFSSPSTASSSSSPGSPFSFTSSFATAVGQSVLGKSSSVGFNSVAPDNDQMNVEDSTAVETNGPLSETPASRVSGNLLATPVFGTPEVQPTPIFQFGGNQSPLPPNQSPFQAASSGEFSAGGSFSLGTGGGDKSGRRIIKVSRDKLRKK